MKIPSVEFTMKAGMLYTGLKTILHSVGLENNRFLAALIQYISLFQAIYELIQEEIEYIMPHIKEYSIHLFQTALDQFIHYFKPMPHYDSKIISLCNVDRENITLKHQQNFLEKICFDFNYSNTTSEHLFNNPKDIFIGLCLILGQNETCQEILP